MRFSPCKYGMKAQSEEIKNFTLLIKSIVGIFCVSCVFNLLFALFHLHGCYSNLWLEYRFKKIVSFLIDSHVSQFIFEPYNLQLEDETHSTRYHEHTTKDVFGG